MVKSLNINLVIILTALITTIGTAPVWDDDTIMKAARKMQQFATDTLSHRKRDLHTSSLVRILEDQYIIARIAEVVSKAIPSPSPFSKEQLFQELQETTPITQILFTRAYHSLVFERLKTLFLKIEHHVTKHQILKNIEPQDLEILKTGIESVAAHLLWSFDLEREYRKILKLLGRERRMDPRIFSKFRKVKLPVYDWYYVRINLLPAVKQPAPGQLQIRNDVTAGEMLESLWKRVENVIAARHVEVCRGLSFNLHAVLDPTPYVALLIAQIRSDARPFTFTEAQLLEVPEATIPLDQLYLTHAYHHLVVETLEHLVLTIKDHFVKFQNREKLGTALAEVVNARTMHRNLRSQCEIIIQRIRDEGVNWQDNVNLPAYELAPVDSMQFPTGGQYSAYNYEPIPDRGPGCGLEASTSQPRPQPVLIDFLGVADMTWKATPELAPPFEHSHDDSDPLPDNRSSNELHRSPSDHVVYVGSSSMHPGPSTDNMKRPFDLSLHGYQPTSNARVAGSPQKRTRFKLFGTSFDYP
ncbi:hypothetical protein SeMB42_g05736 [Synchytrium endobioticum]|uniref:Uncharacterized protein n=2 Tax=Synchytrium endobioticum TaxID=286115 RepID=A0A507CPN3_9FUNG|nr:hypothetical protein SeMB42_g05736 [Synchytrium endobioticum]